MGEWKNLFSSDSITTAEKYRRFEKGPIGLIAKYYFQICSKPNALLYEYIDDIKTGKTPSTTNKAYFDCPDVDWYKPNEIGCSLYVTGSENKISNLAVDSNSGQIFEEGTLLINCIGDIGRVSILKQRGSSNQQITGLRFSKKVIPEYAYYYFLANRDLLVVDQLETTLPIINQKKLKSIPFVYQEFEQQLELVHFLAYCTSCLHTDRIPENLTWNLPARLLSFAKTAFSFSSFTSKVNSEFAHQSTYLTQLRQTILQEAIEGKLTAQWRAQHPTQAGNPDYDAVALLAQIKAEKQRLIAEKKIGKENPLPPIREEEMPFDLPEGWVWCRLGKICSKIGSGSTPRGSNYSESGIPFFRSQNIHNHGLSFDDIKFISSEINQDMISTSVQACDLLLNITGGSLGRCAIVPSNFREGNVSQHVCIIRVIGISTAFLHSLILSPIFQKMIFESTTGAGREGLPKYNLEQFYIPLPPLVEQRAIVERVDRLLAMVDELAAQVAERKSQADALMQAVLREAFQPTPP